MDLEISEVSCVNFQSRSIRSAAALHYEPVRGAPCHVTNLGHLKMHQPGASRMLRCTAL